MKRKITFALAVALLLVAGVTPVMSDAPLHVGVEPGTAAGGAYQLIGQGAAPGTGELSGGNYRLQGGVQPLLTGSGCCCTYLPCITKR